MKRVEILLAVASCLGCAVAAFAQDPAKPGPISGKEWKDAVLAGLEDAERWKPFTSQEKDFSVMLPGLPKRDFQAGTEHDNIIYTLNDGKRQYFTACQSYKVDIAKSRTPDQLLDGGCNGMLRATKGKLLSKAPILLENKYPGREVRFTTEDEKTVIRVRVYWVSPVMYLNMVKGDAEFVQGTDAAMFLNSFRVLKKN